MTRKYCTGSAKRPPPPELAPRFRPMFGGILGYAEDKPFASLSDIGLALKFAEADREALLALPGAKPLQYAPGQPPSKSYVVVPESILADPAALGIWMARSVASLAVKPARTRTKAAKP